LEQLLYQPLLWNHTYAMLYGPKVLLVGQSYVYVYVYMWSQRLSCLAFLCYDMQTTSPIWYVFGIIRNFHMLCFLLVITMIQIFILLFS